MSRNNRNNTPPVGTVEKNAAEQAVGAETQQSQEQGEQEGTVAPPAVDPLPGTGGNPNGEIVPAPETQVDPNGGVKAAPRFQTTIEDVPAAPVERQPATIKMQPDSEEDIRRREERQARAGHQTIRLQGSSKREAEIARGRQKVAEHAARQKLLEGKRAQEGSEGANVAAATQANKDL